MGEELKSPFVDGSSFFSRSHSQLSNPKHKGKKKSYKETREIKDSLSEISKEISYLLPEHKSIPHGVISALYYKLSDLIIALCYDNYLFNYTPSTGSQVSQRKISEMEFISSCANEHYFLAFSKETVFLYASPTLELIKKQDFSNSTKSCYISDLKQAICNANELFILILPNLDINKCNVSFDKIQYLDSNNDMEIVVADQYGITIITEHMQIKCKNYLENIKLVKYTENQENIIAVNQNEIIILNRNLEKIRIFPVSIIVTDVIYDEKNSTLIVGTESGDAWLYDTRVEKRKIIIPMNTSQIVKIIYKENKIFTLATDLMISATRLPKLHNLSVNSVKAQCCILIDELSTVAYIDDKDTLRTWNPKESLSNKIQSFPQTLDPCLAFSNGKIYLSSETDIIQFDTSNNDKISRNKSLELCFNSMYAWDNVLACAGGSASIFLWKVDPLEEDYIFQGHEDNVTCLTGYKKFLVSGSDDYTVCVWDIKKKNKVHVLSGHILPITTVAADNGKIISGSIDRTIKIWYMKSGDLIYTIKSQVGFSKKICILQGEFFISCSSNSRIIFWSFRTYTQVLNNPTYEQVHDFTLNNYYIVYITKAGIFSYRNPLFSTKLLVSGPDESAKYQFLNYINNFICGYTQDYNSDMDRWIIFPYFITPLHLYAYYNFPDYITQAFENGSNLIQSSLDQNALTIAVVRDLESCVENITRQLKTMLEENPFLLSFISDSSLITMNITGHESLPKFYNLIFREIQSEKLPKFLGYNLSLPIYARSVNMMPYTKHFYNDKYIKDNGQPVEYYRSVIKINLEMGSRESLALLKSVCQCKTIEIFNTMFIQAYIQDKWESVKWFMWIQFVIYTGYLLFLGIFLMHFYENPVFLLIPFFLSLILTAYEIYKAIVSGSEYFWNLWNYTDATRAILFFVYFIEKMISGPPKHPSSNQRHKEKSIDKVLLLLTIFSFLKGFSYFRLFRSTRHFTNMIYQVIIDSRAFSVVLFYLTVATAFIFYIAFKFQKDFKSYLGDAFLLNILYLDPTEFDQLQWTIYALGVCVNSLMMMSVLISIYYESIALVTTRSEIENCIAMAAMSLEAERNMFWRRKRKRKLYLQICKKVKVESDSDPIITKVRNIKHQLREIKSELSEFTSIKSDITKLVKLTEQIKKGMPKKKPSKAEKKKLALTLLTLLFKADSLEKGVKKSKYTQKITKIISRL